MIYSTFIAIGVAYLIMTIGPIIGLSLNVATWIMCLFLTPMVIFTILRLRDIFFVEQQPLLIKGTVASEAEQIRYLLTIINAVAEKTIKRPKRKLFKLYLYCPNCSEKLHRKNVLDWVDDCYIYYKCDNCEYEFARSYHSKFTR